MESTPASLLSSVLPAIGAALLVASPTLAQEPPSSSSFAPGSDDFVIGSGKTALVSEFTLATGSPNFGIRQSLYESGPTVEAGDAFAMFWYPELTQASFLDSRNEDDLAAWTTFAPGETSFGAYNTAESTLDPSWKVPDGGLVPFNLFTTAVPDGTADPSVLQAQFATGGVTIPEPSSALLSLFGTGLLLFRRRRG